MRALSVLLTAAVVSAAIPAHAQSTPAADSARALVQKFYTWYVPKAAHPGKVDMIMQAATHGPVAFDTSLVRWLRIDSTARARAKGEVDGLDGDPYTNSQEPCKTYSARAVRPRGANFLVDIVGSGDCPAHQKADVVVEVGHQSGRWTILEIHDPSRNNEGLIPLLRVLHPKAK